MLALTKSVALEHARDGIRANTDHTRSDRDPGGQERARAWGGARRRSLRASPSVGRAPGGGRACGRSSPRRCRATRPGRSLRSYGGASARVPLRLHGDEGQHLAGSTRSSPSQGARYSRPPLTPDDDLARDVAGFVAHEKGARGGDVTRPSGSADRRLRDLAFVVDQACCRDLCRIRRSTIPVGMGITVIPWCANSSVSDCVKPWTADLAAM